MVPVKSLYARPNPVYFGRGKRSRGSTWLAVVNDRVMGLGVLVVRDLRLPVRPRIADLGDAQMWRLDLVDVGLPASRSPRPDNGYRHLNDLGLRKVNVRVIRHHWADMLHVAGSLVTNQVRAYDLLRMLSADGRLTGLGRRWRLTGASSSRCICCTWPIWRATGG